jgi:hypothetical protein
MDLLNDLLGGDQGQQRQDFIRRYEQGSPWSGFDDREAYQEYQAVAPRLSEAQYRESAQEAFARLSPEQRLEFGRWLQTQSRQRGATVPDLDRDGIDDRLQDPGYLAGATTQLRQQQPALLDNLLGSMVGSGGTGMLGGAGGPGLLSSPIAKAAIGGIAAMAMSKFMNR